MKGKCKLLDERYKKDVKKVARDKQTAATGG